jgi:hypothetical protein
MMAGEILALMVDVSFTLDFLILNEQVDIRRKNSK